MDVQGERRSLAHFVAPRRSFVVKSIKGTYPAITAGVDVSYTMTIEILIPVCFYIVIITLSGACAATLAVSAVLLRDAVDRTGSISGGNVSRA